MISRPKYIVGFLALVFLGLVCVQSDPVFWQIPTAAAQGNTSSVFDGIINEFHTKWSVFVEMGMMVSFLIYPIVSALLDPQFFLDVTSGGQNNLLTIWQLSRDIMNTIFAFMLVAGAMMTVVLAKEDYLKKYALKFIIGIILVNFSWFFPRVILDVSNVLTANIYQIPNIVGTQCRFQESDGSFRSCEFPLQFKYFPDENTIKSVEAQGWKCVSTFICYEPEELDNNTNTAGGILSGLMLNHARLGEMNKVMATIAEKGSAAYKAEVLISQLMHIGLQLLLVLYITIILVGMGVALLVRIPILWMTMAFMPLMFLGFVIGDILPEKMNTMNLIFKKFLHAAFLPAAMAVPLAVGFILVNTLAFSPPSSALFLVESTGFILPGINSLWSFLWLLISIIVMWKGFKTALSIDSIFETATNGITSFGDSLGTIVKNAPLNIPFIPAAGGGLTTAGQAGASMTALAGASSRGQFLQKWKQNRLGDIDGEGGTNNISFSNTTKDVINSSIQNDFNQPTDIIDIAKELKKNHPKASDDSLINKVREHIESSNSPIATDTKRLEEKLEEIRKALPSV